MKHFFLRFLLTVQELNVIQQQNVYIPIFLFKVLCAFFADGIDKLVGESFRGNVHNRKVTVLLYHIITDGMDKVGLAEANPSVKK
jgi:hypothetical protein